MDLKTVITNLENTILGKRKLYADLNSYVADDDPVSVNSVACKYIKINIDELERIKADLEEISE